jgi:hypothetical protein
MMESVSDTLSRYYEALKEIASLDDPRIPMDEMERFDKSIEVAQKAIAPVDEVTVVSPIADCQIYADMTWKSVQAISAASGVPIEDGDSDKITYDHPESVEPEETDDRLRVGDEFELMGQNYRVHRVAKKNIVIRKIRTVALPEKTPDMVIIDEAAPCAEMDVLYKDLTGVDDAS